MTMGNAEQGPPRTAEHGLVWGRLVRDQLRCGERCFSCCVEAAVKVVAARDAEWWALIQARASHDDPAGADEAGLAEGERQALQAESVSLEGSR